jgi:hypothetical protein
MSVSDAIPFMRQWLMRYTKVDRSSKFPQAFMVYDYIKLPGFDAGGGKLQEYQLLGLYAGQLHDFMNSYHIPCLAFGQTNREVDRSVNCIAASRRLGELADSVSIMFRKSIEEKMIVPKGNYGLDVVATREGQSTNDDGGYINFIFEPDMGIMEELGYSTGRESDDNHREENNTDSE